MAASGFVAGSYPLGDEMIPASVAASHGKSCAAHGLLAPPQPGWFQPKYVSAAASIPYAPSPK